VVPSLGADDAHRIGAAIEELREHGPRLGRPRADSISGSRHHNMKELRSAGRHLRALFVFDPRWRGEILQQRPLNEARVAMYGRLMEAEDRLDAARRRRGFSETALGDALEASESAGAGERHEEVYLDALAPVRRCARGSSRGPGGVHRRNDHVVVRVNRPAPMALRSRIRHVQRHRPGSGRARTSPVFRSSRAVPLPGEARVAGF